MENSSKIIIRKMKVCNSGNKISGEYFVPTYPALLFIFLGIVNATNSLAFWRIIK